MDFSLRTILLVGSSVLGCEGVVQLFRQDQKSQGFARCLSLVLGQASTSGQVILSARFGSLSTPGQIPPYSPTQVYAHARSQVFSCGEGFCACLSEDLSLCTLTAHV